MAIFDQLNDIQQWRSYNQISISGMYS